MPVQQELPQVQDQSGSIWGNAIKDLTNLAAQGMDSYLKTAGTKDHNEALMSHTADYVTQIKDRDGLNDSQYQGLLKNLNSIDINDPKYEEKVGQFVAPLALWSASGAGKKGVALPDPNLDVQTNISVLKDGIEKADEGKNIQGVIGAPPANAAQSSAPDPGQMGPPAPQTLQSLTLMSQQPASSPGSSAFVGPPSPGQPGTPGFVGPPAPDQSAAQTGAPTTLAASAPAATGLQQLLDNIPTQSGKQQLTALSQQLGKGLTYTDFKKEYINLLKTETAASIAEQKAAKAQVDKLKTDLLTSREVLGDNGQPRPTTLADMENPNLQFGAKLPTSENIVSTKNGGYSGASTAKPVPDRKPSEYNSVYKEAQAANATAEKNGETPKIGIPQITLSVMESDPKITSDKARIFAKQALPVFESASNIFTPDIVPQDKLMEFVTKAKIQGYDDKTIYNALLSNFGDKLSAPR